MTNHRIANIKRKIIPAVSGNYSEIGIIIPAFNPSLSTLSTLISRIGETLSPFSYRLLLIDDGSYPPIAPNFSSPVPLQIIRHEKNCGKGEALKTGFRYFTENLPVQFILTIDADLQHPPEKIPEFIKKIRGTDKGLVIGYRVRKLSVMPFHRILSNYLTSLIISLFTGQLIKDSQCGFRLFESQILRHLHLEEQRFHLESEMLIKIAWQKMSIGFVKIPTIYQREKSAINHWRDTLNFVQLIVKLSGERITGRCTRF